MFDFSAIFAMSGQLVLYRMAAVLAVVTFHGVSLTLIARALGDPGPQQDGRLSPNPMAHLQLLGALTLVLFRVGWMMPLDVNPRRLPGGTVGALAYVALGAVALLGFAIALWWLRPLVAGLAPGSEPLMALVGVIEATARMAVWLALASLLPLPPFAGGAILARLAPALHGWLTRHLMLTMLACGALIFTGVPERLLLPLAQAVERAVLL